MREAVVGEGTVEGEHLNRYRMKHCHATEVRHASAQHHTPTSEGSTKQHSELITTMYLGEDKIKVKWLV